MSSQEFQFWWLGWKEPDSVPVHRPEWKGAVPRVHSWRTGWGDGYTTHVAAVWASSADEAWGYVHALFGDDADKLGEWVACEPLGTHPALSDRFSGFDAAAARALTPEPDCSEGVALRAHLLLVSEVGVELLALIATARAVRDGQPAGLNDALDALDAAAGRL